MPTQAIARPPSAGPAIAATFASVISQERAFGRCSRGTSAGSSASRAGSSTVLIVAESAAMA